MTPILAAEITKLSLELALELIRSVPIEVRQEAARQAWEDHKRTMDFIRGLFDKKD